MKTNATAVQRYWTPERRKNFVGSKKQMLLLPWEAPELLCVLDLMNPEGSLTRSQTKKLFQVNHMLQLLRPQLSRLAKSHATVRICEAACGHSYLSLLLAWYFHQIERHPALILGMDANSKLVEQSTSRAESLGLAHIARFEVQSLTDFNWHTALARQFPEQQGDENKLRPHLFVALHACDSLSCQALSHAVELRADVVAIAPCCQAELAQTWKERSQDFSTHPLQPIIHSPHMRRSLAADYTDSLRLVLLRALGYEAEAIEFVPSEHTPKNRLILGSRHQRYNLADFNRYKSLKESLGGVTISFEKLVAPILNSSFPAQLNEDS